jgi:hypothetical protein
MYRRHHVPLGGTPSRGGCRSRLQFACDAGNTLADDPSRGRDNGSDRLLKGAP